MIKNRISLLNLAFLLWILILTLYPLTGCKTEFINGKANNNVIENATNNSTASNSLATPIDAYKTSFAARQKKDVQLLKTVMSRKMLFFFKDIGLDDHKTIDDELDELVRQPQAKSAEARNEKINGGTATIEYLDENGRWKEMDFVKEGNDWKLTIANGQPTINPKPTEKVYDNSTNNKSKF